MDPGNWGHRGRGRAGRGKGFRRMPDDSVTVGSVPPGQGETAGQAPAPVATSDFSVQPTGSTSEIVEALEDVTLASTSVQAGSSTSEGETVKTIGHAGERCRCLTNFVKLTRTAVVTVYQYHVSFEPSLQSTKMKKMILKQFQPVIGPVSVFDGHALHLPLKLPEEVHMLNCIHPTTKSKEILATIKFVKAKTNEEDLTPFYSLLFQRILTQLGYLEIRRGFYKVSEARNIQREGLEVWPGIYLSVEMKDGGLMVMFDTPNRVHRTRTLYDFYKSLLQSDRDEKKVEEMFRAYAIGKIILCKYSNQCYKVDDVAFKMNPSSTFPYKHQEITYDDYFRLQYNVTINDLNQPLLMSKIKPRNVVHPNPPIEKVRMICLVPELCYETGLTTEHRSNYQLMTEVGAITRLNPRLRISAMTQMLKEITESQITRETLANWGLKLDKEVLDTIGRRINNPALLFHPSAEAKVVSTNFSKEAHRSCYNPVSVSKFYVFCIHKDLDCAKTFITQYGEACSTVGINLRTHGEIIVVNKCGEQIAPSLFVKALEETCDKAENTQFVVVLMPFYRDDFYRAVKKYCLSVNPIPSQCVMSKTLRHRRAIKTVIMNICLQINCKLGGSLWGLQLPQSKKIMILGMDAAHDPTRKHPSVIALVATLNATCSSYFTRCSFQTIHQELCTSLRVMFKDALEAYKRSNAGQLPDRIIFYRDGGSAGSFEVLQKYEVDVCLEVLKEEAAEKAIKFSYLCVAKRIPQRIILRTEGNDIINPPPGTTLDHTITEPYRFDFYIVSQQVNQGTVNPTHYTVLYETNHTKPDVMQKISYALTFMYYNWSGSIKVPGVIQYAHKLGQLVSRVQVLPNRCMSNNLYFL